MTKVEASLTTGPSGLLINTKARLAHRLEARALAALRARGIIPEYVARVRHPKQTGQAVDAMLECGVSRLIVGGGDGTLSTVAGRLAHREVVLGVIPLGTANDMARTLGIPVDLTAAVEVVANGRVRLIDLGRANDAFFLNVASIGMSVSATAEISAGIKRWFGTFAYFYAGARVFMRHITFRVRVQNGADSIETLAHQIVVGNGRFYGGGVLVARESSLEDGLLHAYTLGTRGRWQLLRTIALQRMGIPIDRPGDDFLQTKTLTVETWPTLGVNCDGEILTTTPVTFRVEPRALRVLTPAVRPIQE